MSMRALGTVEPPLGSQLEQVDLDVKVERAHRDMGYSVPTGRQMVEVGMGKPSSRQRSRSRDRRASRPRNQRREGKAAGGGSWGGGGGAKFERMYQGTPICMPWMRSSLHTAFKIVLD